MYIKVDYREKSLHELITKNKTANTNLYEKINIVTENLSIGDIIITDDEGKEVAIIERKTLNDLASSICDGRYSEQSYRLSNCELPNHQIYYLIEGDLSKYTGNRFSKKPITAKTLMSALTSISFYKGFSLYKSANIQESALWILQMTEKIRKTNDKPYSISIPTSTCTCTCTSTIDKSDDYTKVSKRVKKDNITQTNIGAIMLSQIPGVSYVSATAIMAEYKTIKNLIENIERNHLALNHITTDGNRKITKKCISNIISYLVPDNSENLHIVCDTNV
jgi:ERCC4-type nuclease